MRWCFILVSAVYASGCASAEENCAEAKQAADAAWATYIAELDGDLTAAKTNATKLTAQMRDSVGPRMSELAEQAADKRHNRNTPAWHRAYDAHLKASCTVDTECKRLKMDERATALRIDELTVLITKAGEAKGLVSDDVVSAPAAGKAVEDFERDSIKQPREFTDVARDTCADVD